MFHYEDLGEKKGLWFLAIVCCNIRVILLFLRTFLLFSWYGFLISPQQIGKPINGFAMDSWDSRRGKVIGLIWWQGGADYGCFSWGLCAARAAFGRYILSIMWFYIAFTVLVTRSDTISVELGGSLCYPVQFWYFYRVYACRMSYFCV